MTVTCPFHLLKRPINSFVFSNTLCSDLFASLTGTLTEYENKADYDVMVTPLSWSGLWLCVTIPSKNPILLPPWIVSIGHFQTFCQFYQPPDKGFIFSRKILQFNITDIDYLTRLYNDFILI